MAGIVANNCLPADCTDFVVRTGRIEDERPWDDSVASATFAHREVAEAAWCGYTDVVLVSMASWLAVNLLLAVFPH